MGLASRGSRVRIEAGHICEKQQDVHRDNLAFLEGPSVADDHVMGWVATNDDIHEFSPDGVEFVDYDTTHHRCQHSEP